MSPVEYWRMQDQRYDLKGTVDHTTGEKKLFFRPDPIGVNNPESEKIIYSSSKAYPETVISKFSI